jgi:hypothetical protein
VKTWEEFRAEVARLKAERWADILASEPPGRPAGRRPRDPEKEALLAEIDRARLARPDAWMARARREPVKDDSPPK